MLLFSYETLLGVTEVLIMNITHMEETYAYACYCTSYTDCSPYCIFIISFVLKSAAHAEQTLKDERIARGDNVLERKLARTSVKKKGKTNQCGKKRLDVSF